MTYLSPKSPAHTLTEALARFDAAGARPTHALDLGCGAGSDTLELLRRGWRVTAIDRNPAVVAACRTAAAGFTTLSTEVIDFELAEFSACALVNATFALPFCPPAAFPALWQRLTRALASGGRYAGQFFGPHDTWATNPALSILDRKQVTDLLAPDYEIELLLEQEKDGTTYQGQSKHWHVLHVVARRR